MIWTTTPWTLPSNRAIAYAEDINYSVIEIERVSEGSKLKVGEKLVIARALLKDLAPQAKIESFKNLTDYDLIEDNEGKLKGTDLSETV